MDHQEALQRKLDRIYDKLNALNAVARKETWVTSRELQRVTGWDYNKVERMRYNGLVRWKKKSTKANLFLLESISPALYDKKSLP